MSLTAKDMAGVHLIDLISLSNPEIASFGNTSNGAYVKWYHNDEPSNSYNVGLMNYSFNICSNVPMYTTVGIGTNEADSNVHLHVHGTIMASNIRTYNENETLTFNRQNIGGISNITFSGNLFKGEELFKTSQWESVNPTNIYFPGNVGVGGVPGGTDCNLYVVGNVVVTGKITAGRVQEQITAQSRFLSLSLYQPDESGYKQVLTNTANYQDRVLFSTRLTAGRFMVSSILPYKNLSTILTLDTFNWAFIGLYRSTPETYSSASTPICTMQLNNIGSTNEQDIDDVNISWFLEVPYDADYVVAINGRGHLLRFGPYYPEPVRLVLVPIKSLGAGDSVDVRHKLQAKPIRTTFYITQDNYLERGRFNISTEGYYDIQSSNVDIYYNDGTSTRKLYYLNSTQKEFSVNQVTFQNNITSANISLTFVPNEGDLIDATIWLDNTASSYFESGYLYQNFNISTVPWQMINGGGVFLPNNDPTSPINTNKCVIDGDLIVSGTITSQADISSFEAAGIIADYLGNFQQSVNIVNTLNLSDKSVTIPKLDLSIGNLGIGTDNPPERFMVVGNIAPGGDNAFDLGTPSLTWKDLHLKGQLISTAPNSVAPFVVSSSKQVLNLNASLLQGVNSNYYRDVTNMNAGILPIIRGGTGVNTLATNKVIVGAGTNGLTAPVNLHWDSSSSGSLGIGTVTPKFTLDVLGDVRIQNATDANLSLTVGNTSGVAVSTRNDSNLYLNANQSFSNVLISGSVGIGTSIARKPLSVRGEIQVSSNILADAQFLGTNPSSNIPTYSWLSSPTTGITSPATNSMSVMTSGTERLRILDNGNIGIGIKDPDSQFVLARTSGRLISKMSNIDGVSSTIALTMGYNDGNDFFIQKNKSFNDSLDGNLSGLANAAIIRHLNSKIFFQTTQIGIDTNAQLIYTHRPVLSACVKRTTPADGYEAVGLDSGSYTIVFNNIDSISLGGFSLGSSSGTYSTTTGEFTVVVAGKYFISAKANVSFESYGPSSARVSPTSAIMNLVYKTGNNALVAIPRFGSVLKQGVNNIVGESTIQGSTIMLLKVGDKLKVELYGLGPPRMKVDDGSAAFNIIYLG